MGMWEAFNGIGFGWQAIIIFIFAITQLLAAIGVKNIINLWNYSKRKNKPHGSKYKIAELFAHPLFFTADHLLNHKIVMMNFGDTHRNEIFRTLLRVKIAKICCNSKALVENPNIMTLPKSGFKALIYTNFTDIIDSYNIILRNKFGTEIYDLVMQEPIKGFNAWHEPVVVYTKTLVDDICDSDLYNTNAERLYAIFNAYHSAIDAALVSAEKTFHGYNGDLSTLLQNIKHKPGFGD